MSSLFGITRVDGDSKHLYLFPGQVLEDGTTVDPSFRVQCNRTRRDAKPENTIWELESTEVKLHPGGKHYVKNGDMTSIGTLSNPASGTRSIQSLGKGNTVFYTSSEGVLYITKDKELARYTSDSRPERMIPGKIYDGKTYLDIFLEIRAEAAKEPTDLPFGYDIDIHIATTISSEDIDSASSEKVEKTDSATTSTESTPKPEPSWIDKVFKESKISQPTAKKDGFYVSGSNWKLLIRNIKRQVNTLITGPAGTGKTSIVKQAADRLGLPLHIFDMGAMIDPISSLLGVHRLKDGKSIFDYAQFTKAIQEPGIILLDEINRASMGVGNILFPCLDERRYLPVEIANGDGERIIPIHPEVCFIATANIGASYVGTTTLDAALVSRFFPLELGYLSERIERDVLKNRTGIDETSSDLIVKVANTIRNMNAKLELSSSVSVRETLMISNLVRDGWELGEAMKTVFLPMFEGTNNEGERSKLYKVLASY